MSAEGAAAWLHELSDEIRVASDGGVPSSACFTSRSSTLRVGRASHWSNSGLLNHEYAQARAFCAAPRCDGSVGSGRG